ncbi:unnamed protein product, partial [Medioppia subpectinata]
MEVLYVLFTILCIYIIVVSSIALSDTETYTKEDKDIKEEAKTLLATGVIGLILTVIGLAGIVKENKCIVIVVLVLTIVGVMTNFATNDYGAAAWNILCAALTACNQNTLTFVKIVMEVLYVLFTILCICVIVMSSITLYYIETGTKGDLNNVGDIINDGFKVLVIGGMSLFSSEIFRQQHNITMEQ